jgi:hypothetical protein
MKWLPAVPIIRPTVFLKGEPDTRVSLPVDEAV